MDGFLMTFWCFVSLSFGVDGRTAKVISSFRATQAVEELAPLRLGFWNFLRRMNMGLY